MTLRVLLTCVLSLPLAAAEDPIFLFSGQSNMCGYGAKLTELPTPLQGEQAGIQCLYSMQEPWGVPSPEGDTIPKGDKWRPTKAQWEVYAPGKTKYWYVGCNPGDYWTNMYTNGFFGPEYAAARELLAAKGGTISIVKYAAGGTNLQDDWKLDGNLYRSMKYWADKALASRPGSTIAGFFWMQGEGDASYPPAYSNYEKNLTAFIARIRADFGNPDLPFILGRIRPDLPKYNLQWVDEVRKAQVKVAAAVPKVAWVDTDDLQLNAADPIHFGTAGVELVGKRMAKAWLDMTAAGQAARRAPQR